MEKFDPEKTLEAKWAIDSETGLQYLLDLRTGRILAKWSKLHKHEYQYDAQLSRPEFDYYECFCGKALYEATDCGSGA